MNTREFAPLVTIAVLACIVTITAKTLGNEVFRGSWIISLSTFVAVILLLVESERNRLITARGQLVVYAVVIGLIVSDPIIWLIKAADVTAFGLGDAASADYFTFLISLGILGYSWRYRRKKA